MYIIWLEGFLAKSEFATKLSWSTLLSSIRLYDDKEPSRFVASLTRAFSFYSFYLPNLTTLFGWSMELVVKKTKLSKERWKKLKKNILIKYDLNRS